MKRHADDLAGTAEVPHMADGIAAAPRTAVSAKNGPEHLQHTRAQHELLTRSRRRRGRGAMEVGSDQELSPP
jgi:hypothetical protein